VKDHPDINDTLRAEGVDAARDRHDGAKKFNGSPDPARPASGREVKLRTHREVSTAPEEMLVKKLLPRHGIGLVAGQWGTAKTAVVLDLAAALSMEGGTFAGMPIKCEGIALLFILEGADGIPARLETLSREKYDGAEIPIYYTTEQTKLLADGGVERVLEIAHEAIARAKREWNLPVVLIVFDTIMMASGYPREDAEQDNVIGAKLMQALRRVEEATGALVIGVDHFGKNAEAGTRGGSAKEDAADVILALLGDRDPNGKVTGRRMVLRKIRSGAAGAEHSFNLKIVEIGMDEDGDVVSSVVVDWDGVEATIVRPKTPGKASPLLLRVIKTIPPETHRPWADGPAVQAVPESAVRAEFYRQYPLAGETDKNKAAEARKKAFERALIAAKHVMHRDGWIWLAP